MQANLEFFHRRAGEVMATILAMPLGPDAHVDQLEAMKDFAAVIRMRELAQACARDMAKYVHPPIGPIAPAAVLGAGNARARVEHIPVPKAVADAFERAAAGLPPEPRRRL